MKFNATLENMGLVTLVRSVRERVPVALPGRVGLWIVTSYEGGADGIVVDAEPFDDDAHKAVAFREAMAEKARAHGFTTGGV